jgi:hypothetical protein
MTASHQTSRRSADCSPGGLRANRQRDIETLPDLEPEEAFRRHADDGHRAADERERPADDRLVAAEVALPVRVAENGSASSAAALIVGRRQQPAAGG